MSCSCLVAWRNVLCQNALRLIVLVSKHLLLSLVIMPPTLKKLMGHIAFGACVGAWVGGVCVGGCVTLFVPTVTFKPLKLES